MVSEERNEGSQSKEDDVPKGFWRKAGWALRQMFGRRQRNKKESLAWKRQKREIVEGGTKILVCLLIIDILLFSAWMMRSTEIVRQKDEADASSGQWESHRNDYPYEAKYEADYGDEPIEGESEDDHISAGLQESEAREEETERSCEASAGVSHGAAGYGRQQDLKKKADCSACDCKCQDKCKGAGKKAIRSPEEIRRERELLARKRRVARRRLTATCKANNVLHRPIPSDRRAAYFMEYVYKPWSADSELPEKTCSSPGCQWLRSFLSNDNPAVIDAARQHAPCDDFYRHVCEARPRTPYQRGAHMLMDAMRRLLKKRKRKVREGKLPYSYVSLFTRCLEGRDVIVKDHITYDWEEKKMRGCPTRVPTVPLQLSERFFRTRTGSRATMPEFFNFVAGLTKNLSLDDRVAPAEKGYVAREWVPGACQWVARAARCHYFMDLQMPDDEHLSRYQLYWKLMYFSPLLGPKTQRIYEEVFSEPPKARVQACFNLMEDHYYMNATKLARRVLKETVPRPHDVLSRVGWFVRWALRNRVPTWLARRNGTRIAQAAASKAGAVSEMAVAAAARNFEFNASVAREVRRHLEALDTDLMHSTRRNEAPEVSLFSNEGRYANKRKSVVVPPALVAVMMNATPSLDPIMTALVGVPILRVLLPRKGGAYSWRWASERRLNRITNCVQNKMAGSKAVAEKVVTESAVLEPLFDAFRRSLADDVGLGHRLNERYSNSELPYVLWALGHCGDPMGDVIVNGAVNNSAHFARTFGCTRGDRLWSEDKCPFWA